MMKKIDNTENGDSKILDDFMASIPTLLRRKVRLKMAIAAQIDEALIAKGWTQKEFALKLGKRESEVSKWLSGKQNFTLDTIALIEETLGEFIIQVPLFPREGKKSDAPKVHEQSPAALPASREKIRYEFPLSAIHPISIRQISLQPVQLHERVL